MKTIGILGGIGPQATMDFEARLHWVAQQTIPQHWNSGYPPLFVCYVRHPPFVLDENHAPVVPWQPDPRLLEAAAKLGAVADFLVITSNATHTFQPQIEQASGRKVLSMIDATVKHVQERGWRRVGVLGLREPVIYTKRLDDLSIAHETIDDDLRDDLDRAIFRVMEGGIDAESSSIARRAIDLLRGRGVDGIILGCTEIAFLLVDPDSQSDLINPLQLLAEAAMGYALQTE